MAQIFGAKIKKTHKNFMTPDSFTEDHGNKFTTRDGTEFILHEFDSGHGSVDMTGINSRDSYKKKRGRPRKGEIAPRNESWESFDSSPNTKARREQRKERKREKLRRSLEESFNDDTPKKRGRPRKFDFQNASNMHNQSNSIPEYIIDFNSLDEQGSSSMSYSSGFDSRNGYVEAATEGISDILRNDQGEHVNVIMNESSNQSESEMHWTPIQRLIQISQALALTNMYKDLLFWDRIVAEFIDPNVQFRLELGSEKAFDIPFIVISKFFWVNSQIGLHRLQIIFNGINQLMKPDEINNGVVLFNSSESFIYSQFYKEKLMIIHRAFQFIEFDSTGKIIKWNIRLHKYDKYYKESLVKDDAEGIEEFIYGFPKRLLEFLDVALVMNSVLPDPSSWLTWFYTYIQQNGLQNISIVELSRIPSPYKFFDELEDKKSLEFMGREQDFIFNILSTNRVGGKGGCVEDIINNLDFDSKEMMACKDFENALEELKVKDEKEFEDMKVISDNNKKHEDTKDVSDYYEEYEDIKDVSEYKKDNFVIQTDEQSQEIKMVPIQTQETLQITPETNQLHSETFNTERESDLIVNISDSDSVPEDEDFFDNYG